MADHSKKNITMPNRKPRLKYDEKEEERTFQLYVACKQWLHAVPYFAYTGCTEY